MISARETLLAQLAEPSHQQAFADQHRVRIKGALPEALARDWSGALGQQQDWLLTMGVKGQTARVAPQVLQTYPAEQRQQLERDLHEEAAAGRGFIYDSIEVSAESDGFLGEAYALLSDDKTLAAISQLIGRDVRSVSAQATRYRPGQWLTRHRDDPQGETRQLAYVLSLTDGWHPDWGGLLQFFQDDGTPLEAWTPGLGVLSLFDVRQVHSVTYVAPYAKAPRLAITGWFSA